MAYIPKIKITIQDTDDPSQGPSLIYKSTNTSYSGKYIETANGKYYAGTNNVVLGPELIKHEDNHETDEWEGDKYVQIHKLFKKNIKKFLNNTIDISSFKPIPTNKDYERGFFVRHFAKRINGDSYIEIDQETHDNIRRKKGKYDYNLYEVGTLNWHIKGNTHKLNSISISKKNQTFPNLLMLFPSLSEFILESTPPQENQYTNGGELYLADGVEYIGLYHIHPQKGPMKGTKHTSLPHPKLYYFSQLPKLKNNSYEDFTNEYNKIICYKCNIKTYKVESIITQRDLGCPKGYTLKSNPCKDILPDNNIFTERNISSGEGGGY